MSRTRGQQGTLEQLPDGRWKARYRLAGRNGKRPQKTFDDKRDAARWLRDGLVEAERLASGDTKTHARRRYSQTTIQEAVEKFVATLDVNVATRRTTATRLAVFVREFGHRTMDDYPDEDELRAWRLSIPEGWRADVFKAARRVTRLWHRRGWIPNDPTLEIDNPQHRAAEVTPLLWKSALLLEEEIDRRYQHVPILGCGTGLRPEEWLALERRDVDLAGRVLHVRRVWSSGQLTELSRDGNKGWRQRRRVPLRQAVVDRLDLIPKRIDTRLLVPAPNRRANGDWHFDLNNFRRRIWEPAFVAADLPYQRPYDMRHTYASESLATGDVGLFELSRFMGTSLQEIDGTYGHLVADADERNRLALDRYDQARSG